MVHEGDMARVSTIMHDCCWENGEGLEIGPLDKPMIQKIHGRKISYADYTTQAELRLKSSTDPSVDINNIPDIDFIISPLPESLGKQFDYIISSHVAEHVPDLIGWLKTLAGWLKPGGIIGMAIPDKRATFDIKREVSTAGQLIEAFIQKRQTPNISSIYDGFSQAVRLDLGLLLGGDERAIGEHMFSKEISLDLAKKAFEENLYRDCHCWVFTSASFKAMMEEIRFLGLFDFEWAGFTHTPEGAIEFYAAIRPL